MAKAEVAIVAGVGPGLGAALGRRLAKAGMKVVVAARDKGRIESLARECGQARDGTVEGHVLDVTDEAAVEALFDAVRAKWGEPDIAIYNAGAFMKKSILDSTAEEFDRCWRVGCFGGFLFGRAAARGMVERASGTILFTGATASLRGSAQFFNLAVGKFGLKALAESMARELGPKGVHVAHIVIDGQIQSERYAHLAAERPPDGLIDPDAIAETYLELHRQHRSAWTFETELRPWVEKF